MVENEQQYPSITKDSTQLIKQEGASGTGRGKGKNSELLDRLQAEHQVTTNNRNFGAKFSKNQIVSARDRSGAWKLAEIVDIRREEVNSDDEEENTKEASVLSQLETPNSIQKINPEQH